ncbi:MAG: phosphatidylserine decarboxylase family protein [Verrucomicrobia bacterium]|nr:phosphatidylserine decarboxylase family protein [Verrucomicrobiota bacterium]
MFTMRTLLEGKWPILVLVIFLVATLVWCPVRGAWLLPAALLVFVFSFFRDPNRAIPIDPKQIVAPTDGRVVEITTVNEPLYFKGEAKMVGIFMSVFNVHVQRAPVAGRIELVQYSPGQFLDVRDPVAGAVNENRFIGIAGADGARYGVRQIAGLIARRIVGWADKDATVSKGDRIGMIRFGSRVDLLVPVEMEILARIGDHVKGGESIVAQRK